MTYEEKYKKLVCELWCCPEYEFEEYEDSQGIDGHVKEIRRANDALYNYNKLVENHNYSLNIYEPCIR